MTIAMRQMILNGNRMDFRVMYNRLRDLGYTIDLEFCNNVSCIRVLGNGINRQFKTIESAYNKLINNSNE